MKHAAVRLTVGFLPVALCALALTGCARMFGGTTQRLTVTSASCADPSLIGVERTLIVKWVRPPARQSSDVSASALPPPTVSRHAL